jgi:hypothetical protein
MRSETVAIDRQYAPLFWIEVGDAPAYGRLPIPTRSHPCGNCEHQAIRAHALEIPHDAAVHNDDAHVRKIRVVMQRCHYLLGQFAAATGCATATAAVAQPITVEIREGAGRPVSTGWRRASTKRLNRGCL